MQAVYTPDWIVNATFDVYVTIDFPTDVVVANYEPKGEGWWKSDRQPSEYRYLADESPRSYRISPLDKLPKWFQYTHHMPQKPNGMKKAFQIQYHKRLTHMEFLIFAWQQNKLLVNHIEHPLRLEPDSWSIASVDFVDHGYYDPSVPSGRRIDVIMDINVDVYPQGTPPEGYTLEDALTLSDELDVYVHRHWGLQ